MLTMSSAVRRAAGRQHGAPVVITSLLLVVACGARSGLLDDGTGTAADAGSDGSPSGALDASGSHDSSSPPPSDASLDADDALDSAGPPPSCAPGGPGLTDCGPALQNCCATSPVPAGTYYRTYANDGSGPSGEADPATVTGLRLDTYEVTVGRFRRFAAAWSAGYRPAPGSGKHVHLHGGLGLANSASPGAYEPGWAPSDEANVEPTDAALGSCGIFSTWTPSPGDSENKPIDCVTWPEAYAFCIWDGGFLPSESEWEFAAAGGSQQREYPWGSADPGTANQYAIYGCYYEPSDALGQCDFTAPPGFAPVGTPTLGAGAWGQVDLAGNVWEQTLDSFAAYVDPCDDCAYLEAGAPKMVRGGSFLSGTTDLMPTARFALAPAIRNNYVGFRCARAP
jgi:formylglycine-generating enzyme required for sulfatase activity